MFDELMDQLRRAAAFRENLIERDNPSNAKNETYAGRLRAVIAYAESLPADHPSVKALNEYQGVPLPGLPDDIDEVRVLPNVWNSLIHCDFDDLDRWFDDLVTSIVEQTEPDPCDDFGLHYN